MAKVEIFWEDARGRVAPASFNATHGEQVDWSATGSSATVTFTKPEIFGVDELFIPEGGAKTVKVQPEATPGAYTFPIHCEKDPGDGTPPVTMIID